MQDKNSQQIDEIDLKAAATAVGNSAVGQAVGQAAGNVGRWVASKLNPNGNAAADRQVRLKANGINKMLQQWMAQYGTKTVTPAQMIDLVKLSGGQRFSKERIIASVARYNQEGNTPKINTKSPLTTKQLPAFLLAYARELTAVVTPQMAQQQAAAAKQQKKAAKQQASAGGVPAAPQIFAVGKKNYIEMNGAYVEVQNFGGKLAYKDPNGTWVAVTPGQTPAPGPGPAPQQPVPESKSIEAVLLREFIEKLNNI